VVYIFSVFIFGYVYYFSNSLGRVSFLDSLYFSFTTITTVGYGDITPKTMWGKLIACAEVVWGIVVLSFFVNSAWQHHINSTENRHNKILEEQTRRHEKIKIAMLSKELKVTLENYVLAFFDLTTPLRERSRRTVIGDFIFTDMRDMFKISSRYRAEHRRSVLETYFDEQDILSKEIRYFLSVCDHSQEEKLIEAMRDLNFDFRKSDERESLFDKQGACTSVDGSIVSIHTEEIEKMILSMPENPDISQYKGNIITPFVKFYYDLKSHFKYVSTIVAEVDRITGGNDSALDADKNHP